jgi:hypothetical protein
MHILNLGPSCFIQRLMTILQIASLTAPHRWPCNFGITPSCRPADSRTLLLLNQSCPVRTLPHDGVNSFTVAAAWPPRHAPALLTATGRPSAVVSIGRRPSTAVSPERRASTASGPREKTIRRRPRPTCALAATP